MEEEEKRKESKKNQQRPPQQKDKIKVQPETSGRSQGVQPTRQRYEMIERAQRKEKSWECTRYLKHNEKAWQKEEEKNCKVAKCTRLKRASEQKTETLTRIRQKRITETWSRLPEEERRRLQAEENTRKRQELREAMINLWKKQED